MPCTEALKQSIKSVVDGVVVAFCSTRKFFQWWLKQKRKLSPMAEAGRIFVLAVTNNGLREQSQLTYKNEILTEQKYSCQEIKL